MSNQMPVICLLIGPGGSGKTTTSSMLAQKYKRCAVIEVDEIRHMIKRGHVDPFLEEGYDQLVLSTENTCSLAKNFAERGFNVIIDDCVTGKERLDMYYQILKGYRLKTILLFPNKSSMVNRDANRTGRARLGDNNLILYNKFLERIKQETRWSIVNNSHKDPKETTEEIHGILSQ